MENDLREQAIRAISNYMHNELFEITGDTKMLPFLKNQAENIINICDKAINQTKNLVKSNN